MMKKAIFPLFLITSTLISCGERPTVHYEISSYKTDIQWKENFVICLLNDIHISASTDLNRTFSYLDRLLLTYNEDMSKLPDLVIINGDTFMSADKRDVRKTFDHFDSWGIPYCFTYGNHDYQSMFSPSFINSEIMKHSNSLLKNPKNDDVYGNSNYFVNLVDEGDVIYQIFMFDSNNYRNFGYDFIHDDQVDWYERALLSANQGKTKEEYAKSMMFFHMPTPEFDAAIDEYKTSPEFNLDDYYDVRDTVSRIKNGSKLFNKISEYDSTVAISVGHNHNNNVDLWTTIDRDLPLRLIYGQKSSDENYHKIDMMGACFYTLFSSPKISLKDTNNELFFSLKRINYTYEGERTVLCENLY